MAHNEQKYLASLEHLWDSLSDAVESGRLTRDKIPQDYDELVQQMIECEHLNHIKNEG